MIEYELTVHQWLRVLGLEGTIYDWDGFRDIWDDTTMTHVEFQHRYAMCTIRLRSS